MLQIKIVFDDIQSMRPRQTMTSKSICIIHSNLFRAKQKISLEQDMISKQRIYKYRSIFSQQ